MKHIHKFYIALVAGIFPVFILCYHTSILDSVIDAFVDLSNKFNVRSYIADEEYDYEYSDCDDDATDNDDDLVIIRHDYKDSNDHVDDSSRSTVETREKTRKNVLFLISDDLRPQLNSYKGPHHPNPYSSFEMITPNLDSLAQRSLVLTQAYAQYAVCGPSRTSFLTGRRPDTTKVWDLSTYWRTNGGNFTTIPQFYKNQGYISVGLGKVFHKGPMSNYDDPESWTEPYYRGRFMKQWLYGKSCWTSVPTDVRRKEPLPDDDVTIKAKQLLRQYARKARTGEQPFFMAVGYHKPHVPYNCPSKFFQLYPLDQMEPVNNLYFPKNFPEIHYHLPEHTSYREFDKYNCSKHMPEPMCSLPESVALILRRAYFACVSYIDALIGELVEELDELGLTDSTVISFIGDHGYHIGENSLFGKHTNMEQSAHVPFFVTIPGKTDHGVVSNSMVELVDLFPTIVDASGLGPIPECPLDSSDIELCSDGASLVPLVSKPSLDIKKGAVSQIKRSHSMGYSLRTADYRYMEWPDLTYDRDDVDVENFPCDNPWEPLLAAELYDHSADPEENRNVADDPEYAGVREELSKLLHTLVPKEKVVNYRLDYCRLKTQRETHKKVICKCASDGE